MTHFTPRAHDPLPPMSEPRRKLRLSTKPGTCDVCGKPVLYVYKYRKWIKMTPGGKAHHDNFCPKLAIAAKEGRR